MAEAPNPNPNPNPNSLAAAVSGEHFDGGDPYDGDSTCSTPFVSAPSSPTRDPFGGGGGGGGGFFFSAPASPTRGAGGGSSGELLDFDFDFSARFPPSAAAAAAAAMSSADELFLNGQIRPMRLSSLLLRPQGLPPLLDLASDGQPPPSQEAAAAAAEARGRLRCRSVHRKARSLSPFRSHWPSPPPEPRRPDPDPKEADTTGGEPTTPSASRSSSSSSSSSTSSSRSSRRWVFLKELLHRSKSDGGTKERPFPPLFSFSKDRPKQAPPQHPPSLSPARKQPPSPSGVRGRRRRSAHERLYEARRAEAEEMRRRTFLPYRQGLLGCLGFSSRGYGAINGLARGLNAVSSRS